jgi:hypothetical protein
MTKLPPVPSANRSPKGPDGGALSDGEITREDAKRANRIDNRKEQGQAGNLAQNTRNQGYQQDR